MGSDRRTWLNQPTRRRILDAAERWFADVGYDSARVDDIAATAEVSKSHLYYHFPGKAELLSGLVELRTTELLAGKDDIFGGLTPRTLEGDPHELAAALERVFTETLRPRQRFVRIVLIEALKKSEAVDPVLAAFDVLLTDTVERFRMLGASFDPRRAKTILFHFGIVPALFAVALDTSRFGLDIDSTAFAFDLAIVEQGVIRALLKG